MKRFFRYISDRFLNRQLDFRARIFNLLAMTGMVLGVLIAVSCVATNAGPVNIAINLFAAALAFALLLYADRTGRYVHCYLVTTVVVFILAFPVLFFTAGGYYSGMPSFFIFAISFTVFMLDGKSMYVMTLLELAVYIGICAVAYRYPHTVSFFGTEQDVVLDIVIGFTAVSATLGVTLSLHFGLYNRQQRELESAREEAIRLSDAKSSFLASMSHEIRTPINVMLGMNEMILRESDSGPVKSYGRNIQNAGKTLLLLIDNILDVSKIESGKLSLMEESYETADLVNDLTLIGAELVGRYGLSFRTVTDETLPRLLTGDFIHIKQVIANFLSNAAKYTKEGGVTLRFSGRAGRNPDEVLLRIEVMDTGIGVKPENIPLLFDAFMRADMPLNSHTEGTGLGLAIAREFAQLMGGHISVESEWGRGSVFSLELAQSIDDSTPIGSQYTEPRAEQSPKPSFIAPGGSVLVVDDNRENLQVIQSLLSRTMLRVDAVSSGEACLKAAVLTRYHVMLMDYMMPGMDGVETLKRLKAMPGFNTPVVALTANVVAGVRQKLLDAGFCEYLSKPVMWRDLESAMLRLLPPELVTPGTANPGAPPFGAERQDELAAELARFGVLLEGGLRYLGGDILQYRKLASFFVENFDIGRQEIAALADQRNWERMKYGIHSLKSKARAVGADGLSATAAKLEGLCVAGDGAYIAAVLPQLFHEWSRVRDGLAAFAARLAGIPEHGAALAPVELKELSALLRYNRQPDALEALDGLIAAAAAPDEEERLREIRKKVDDVEFREAERLLAGFMGGDAYVR